MTMIARQRAVVLCIMLCFSVKSAGAASFDCAKAQHPVEKAICGNRDLSRLDEEMALLYTQLLKQTAGDAASRIAVQEWQRTWIKSLRDQQNRITDKKLMLSYEEMILTPRGT